MLDEVLAEGNPVVTGAGKVFREGDDSIDSMGLVAM